MPDQLQSDLRRAGQDTGSTFTSSSPRRPTLPRRHTNGSLRRPGGWEDLQALASCGRVLVKASPHARRREVNRRSLCGWQKDHWCCLLSRSTPQITCTCMCMFMCACACACAASCCVVGGEINERTVRRQISIRGGRLCYFHLGPMPNITAALSAGLRLERWSTVRHYSPYFGMQHLWQPGPGSSESGGRWVHTDLRLEEHEYRRKAGRNLLRKFHGVEMARNASQTLPSRYSDSRNPLLPPLDPS